MYEMQDIVFLSVEDDHLHVVWKRFTRHSDFLAWKSKVMATTVIKLPKPYENVSVVPYECQSMFVKLELEAMHTGEKFHRWHRIVRKPCHDITPKGVIVERMAPWEVANNNELFA